MNELLALRRLQVSVASKDALDVREFHVRERISSLFEITLVAMCDSPDIDLEAIVGQPMSFTARVGVLPHQTRTWSGVCSDMAQTAVEENGLSTYRLRLVPQLWFATQRRNHRIFQHKSEVDIALQLFAEWGVQPEMHLSGTYKKRKYRVQYGESDHAFLSRLLEDAGVSFYFETIDGESRLFLHDAPQSNEARTAIAFRDKPTDADLEHVTAMHLERRIRPGKYTLRDQDYRRPATYPLLASAAGAPGVEARLERFHYVPGAFLFESERGDATPAADDKGRYRTDEGEGQELAKKRIDAKRGSARRVSFDTNTIDPQPGHVLRFLDHPREDLGAATTWLVVESEQSGKHDSRWSHRVTAASTETPFRPALSTPKPRASGVETATVVGPSGEEIHTDEFGRVRVQFHWDREGGMDDASSCWIPVSQPWGGSGFGGSNLPRVGQEVIIDFLSGDPDRPVIVGRVYTNLQKTPYKLPDNKTQSGWKSNSSPQTGGYNEMMFEDAAGKELLRMQAEKDLHKLVKNDEQVKIGQDRSKEVGRDDSHQVGRDRSRQVGRNEDVSIGGNRDKTVQANESESIGKNKSRFVGQNESSDVGQNKSENVGQNRSENVGQNKSENVGQNKDVTVGGNYSISAGGDMSTKVGGNQDEDVAQKKTVKAGEKAEITVGKSKIILEASGKVTIKGTEINIESEGPVKINGKKIEVEAEDDLVMEAGGQAELNGDKVKITGDPIDLN